MRSVQVYTKEGCQFSARPQGDPRVKRDPLRGDGDRARLSGTPRARREGRLDEAAAGVRRLHLSRQHARGRRPPPRTACSWTSSRTDHARGHRLQHGGLRHVRPGQGDAQRARDPVQGGRHGRRTRPAVDELAARSGMRTLPQVYVGSILVGGGTRDDGRGELRDAGRPAGGLTMRTGHDLRHGALRDVLVGAEHPGPARDPVRARDRARGLRCAPRAFAAHRHGRRCRRCSSAASCSAATRRSPSQRTPGCSPICSWIDRARDERVRTTLSEVMSEVVVYTTTACGYCVRVKMLLTAREIDFREINIAGDPEAFVELAKSTGMMTLPQVFIGDVLVGGYNETAAADESGRLQELLPPLSLDPPSRECRVVRR